MNRSAPSLRIFAFLIFTALCALLLMAVQNLSASLAAPLFLGLVVMVGGYGLIRSPRSITTAMDITNRALQHGQQGLTSFFSHVRRFVTNHQAVLIPLVTGTCALVMILSAVIFRFSLPFTPALNQAVGLMLVGTGLMGLMLWLARPSLMLRHPQVVVQSSLIRWRLVGIGAFILLVLAEVNAKVFNINVLKYVTSDAQFGMLCLGISLVVIGLGGFQSTSAAATAAPPYDYLADAPQSIRQRRIGLVLVIGVVLLGIGIRFYHLNDTNRFFIDEVHHVFAMDETLTKPHIPILVPFSGMFPFPYIYPYLQKESVELFGHNYSGLRGASAIMGGLTVLAIYWLGEALFDRRTALIAALLLATFPPHIHFSRIGLNNIADPLFGTMALAFLARGLMRHSRLDYAVGGAMLGLTHYFYEGGRLLYTPLVIVWVVGCLLFIKLPESFTRWQFIKSQRFMLLVAMAALVITAAPIYYTLIGKGLPLASRMVENRTGLNAAYWDIMFERGDWRQHIDDHVIPPFLVYVNRPDDTLFYGGKTAMLLMPIVPAFLLGAAYLIWRWRAAGGMLLLLWIFAASMANSLLTFSATYTRFVVVFPALMLVAAVGIRYTLPLLFHGRRFRRWQPIYLAVLGIGLSTLQANYYFGEHIPTIGQETRSRLKHADVDDAILRSVDFPAGTQLHIISTLRADQNFFNHIQHFFREDLKLFTMTPNYVAEGYLDTLACDANHAFFVEMNDWATIHLLHQKFYLRPAAFTPYDDVPPRKAFILFFAPHLPGSETLYQRSCTSS